MQRRQFWQVKFRAHPHYDALHHVPAARNRRQKRRLVDNYKPLVAVNDVNARGDFRFVAQVAVKPHEPIVGERVIGSHHAARCRPRSIRAAACLPCRRSREFVRQPLTHRDPLLGSARVAIGRADSRGAQAIPRRQGRLISHEAMVRAGPGFRDIALAMLENQRTALIARRDDAAHGRRLASRRRAWGLLGARSAKVLVGDTGIEPVTSSVSGKRATAAPIAQEQAQY